MEPLGQHPPPGDDLRGDGARGAGPPRPRAWPDFPDRAEALLMLREIAAAEGVYVWRYGADRELISDEDAQQRLYSELRSMLAAGAARMLDGWRSEPPAVQRALLWLLSVLPDLRAGHQNLVERPCPSSIDRHGTWRSRMRWAPRKRRTPSSRSRSGCTPEPTADVPAAGSAPRRAGPSESRPVPGVGLEPTIPHGQSVLSRSCIPIPAPGRAPRLYGRRALRPRRGARTRRPSAARSPGRRRRSAAPAAARAAA